MRSSKSKIIVGVIAFFLVLSVGYALFSRSLNLSGTAKAEGSFDIIFDRVEKITEEGSKGATATIEETKKHNLEVVVPELQYPGAYASVDTVIKNVGSVDAVLKGIIVKDVNGNEINVDELSSDDIEVTFTGVAKNEVMKPNDEKKITLMFKWKRESVNPSSSVTFEITMQYEQAVGSEETTSSIAGETGKCTEFTKKDTYSVGDVVALCNSDKGKSEDFYVTSDNGSTVTALAKYNLLVGNIYDMENDTTTPISTSDENYGLQDERTSVIDENSTKMYGTISFASIDNGRGYWADSDGNLLPSYGSSYPINVLNSSSQLYKHVNNYSNYINSTLNKNSIKVTIPTYDTLVGLGCDATKETCTTAPSWVYNVGYWTQTANSSADEVWNVMVFSGDFSLWGHLRYDGVFGIRPLITISKSEL